MNPTPAHPTSPLPLAKFDGEPTQVGLIIVGDEILSGKRTDKHLPKVIELLSARGMQLAWADYVGDSPQRLTQTLTRAFASGGIVLSTGGIGATPDDHTRQSAVGLPFIRHRFLHGHSTP